jgi:hypothetical protein
MTGFFFTGLFMAAKALYLFPIGNTIYGSSQDGQIMALDTLPM